jgi:hypothetical protein
VTTSRRSAKAKEDRFGALFGEFADDGNVINLGFGEPLVAPVGDYVLTAFPSVAAKNPMAGLLLGLLASLLTGVGWMGRSAGGSFELVAPRYLEVMFPNHWQELADGIALSTSPRVAGEIHSAHDEMRNAILRELYPTSWGELLQSHWVEDARDGARAIQRAYSHVSSSIGHGLLASAEGSPPFHQQLGDCIVCNSKFQRNSVLHWASPPNYTPWQTLTLGTGLVCKLCLPTVWGGTTLKLQREFKASLSGLRDYADLLGRLPDAGWPREPLIAPFGDIKVWADLRPRLSELASIRQRMPKLEAVRQTVTSMPGGWLELLGAAGLLDVVGTSRGTAARASDGHWCRSSLEYKVCEALTRSGIQHESEPAWPPHPLNAREKMRADFQVDDVFIEILGLTGDEAYDAKSLRKRQIAKECNVPTIFLTPRHVNRFVADVAEVGPIAIRNWAEVWEPGHVDAHWQSSLQLSRSRWQDDNRASTQIHRVQPRQQTGKYANLSQKLAGKPSR